MSTRVVLLVFFTLFFLWVSWWASLKEKRYHGLYRFFSFESILLLVLLNAHVWFKEPLSLLQIFSWILLAFSLIMAILGFHLLIRTGKPEGRFENTTSLIVSGIYRYIRHPLYCSLLLGGTGAWLKDPFNLFGIGLVLINTMAIYFTSREEEKEMIKKFGNEYKVYMNSTKMFIPFLI